MFWKSLKKIKRPRKEIEPHEVFLDKLAQRKEQEFGFSEQKFEVPLSQKKLKIFYLAFLILIIILLGKTFQLQIIKGDNLAELAERNKQRLYLVQPIRGVIYDSSMNQLVFNKSSYDLIIDIKELPYYEREKSRVILEVSELLSEDYSELRKKIKGAEFNIVLVRENLDHETLILLETKIQDFPGFKIQENTVRNYENGQEFAHLIGFTGKIDSQELKELENYSVTDYIGKQSLEKFYERVLRGEPGKILVERDALGNKISEEVFSLPQTGDSLVLWLDSGLQERLTLALKDSMERVGSEKAAAVAIDPNTGGVLALVSLPSFDNSLFSQGISQEDFQEIINNPYQPLFNRVVSGGYPVGSTIKPFIAAAALEEEIISPKNNILCQGEISIPNPYFPDQPSIFLDWKIHGRVNLRKAIAESCNVYFYILGGGYKDIEGLGVKRIKKYLQLFGWGRETGVDVAGEISGRIPDPKWKEEYFEDYQQKIWRIGDTYHLSIGQGDISVTPLQVAMAFGAIANGGVLYQPQMVKEIVNGSVDSLGVVREFSPKVIRKDFIDPGNLEIVREGMREAVVYGSSITLKGLPVKAASKTGTAQTPREEMYHNWVAVLAPYDDPQIVLTIVIEDVEGMQFAALPVARDTLGWYFSQ